jgi:hypothetical protein
MSLCQLGALLTYRRWTSGCEWGTAMVSSAQQSMNSGSQQDLPVPTEPSSSSLYAGQAPPLPESPLVLQEPRPWKHLRRNDRPSNQAPKKPSVRTSINVIGIPARIDRQIVSTAATRAHICQYHELVLVMGDAGLFGVMHERSVLAGSVGIAKRAVDCQMQASGMT